MMAGLTCQVKDWEPLAEPEPAAVTVKLYVPEVVGVPVTAPERVKLRPGGKLPAVTAKPKGPPRPPLAWNEADWGPPTVMGLSPEEVRDTPGMTEIDALPDAVAPLASVTVTEKDEVP